MLKNEINNSKNILNNIHFYKTEFIIHTFQNMMGYNFSAFKSINNIIYIIYANINKSIISYNLIENKKINEIINAHENEITGFRYYLDKINKRDLIIKYKK